MHPNVIAALFTITKTWKQPKCLSTNEWIKKMCVCVYTVCIIFNCVCIYVCIYTYIYICIYTLCIISHCVCIYVCIYIYMYTLCIIFHSVCIYIYVAYIQHIYSVYIYNILIHRIEYYSAIKKIEIMAFAATWVNLKIIILNEVSQTKTNII